MKKVNIGLIGFGTIGSGVAEVLENRQKFIREHSGLDVAIKWVCDKNHAVLKKVRLGQTKITSNAYDVLRDKNIDIVTELIGGTKEAKDVIVKAIKAKKHVVTANKALLALYGREIFKIADKNSIMVRFGASVGGGIPIIRALREGFISNRLDRIYGIINGTSNFILTKMADGKYDFGKALREAQEKGFAERNPELDISGMDSAHKLAILILIGFRFPINFKDIYVEGIGGIEAGDIEYAKEYGYTIKLLAIAKRNNGRLEARVHPTLLPNAHVLSNVSGIYNAIHIKGDLIGESLFYGEGAGKFPTAGTVVSDIIDIGSRLRTESKDYILVSDSENKLSGIKKIGEIRTRYYARFSAIDKPGVLAKISGILARHNISIASVTQKERKTAQVVPIVMMTHEVLEADMQKAIRTIDNLDIIKDKSIRIKVESE